MSGGCTPSVVKGEGNTNEYKYPNLVHTRVECFYFFGCLYLAGKLDLRLQGKELKGRMTGLGFFFAFFFLCSVVSNSLQPHGLEPTRLLCPGQEYWSGLPFPSPGRTDL